MINLISIAAEITYKLYYYRLYHRYYSLCKSRSYLLKKGRYSVQKHFGLSLLFRCLVTYIKCYKQAAKCFKDNKKVYIDTYDIHIVVLIWGGIFFDKHRNVYTLEEIIFGAWASNVLMKDLLNCPGFFRGNERTFFFHFTIFRYNR